MAPLPMAPLPIVVRDEFGGEAENWGCPSELWAAVGSCNYASAAWSRWSPVFAAWVAAAMQLRRGECRIARSPTRCDSLSASDCHRASWTTLYDQ